MKLWSSGRRRHWNVPANTHSPLRSARPFESGDSTCPRPKPSNHSQGAGFVARLKVAWQQLATSNSCRKPELIPGGMMEKASQIREQGQTAIFVAVNGQVAGLIGIADPIKASAKDAIRLLHAEGVRIVMLTGDNRTTADAVARQLGIDDVRADVLPADKGKAVEAFQAEGRIVAMAGDGINDAPALAQAQVGIAMGTGTDVAMESAGVTLMKGDLQGIVRARRLSRATMQNIRQNLMFAFAYNVLGVPIAAGVLYPFFGLLLSPYDRQRRDDAEFPLRRGQRTAVTDSAAFAL
jgi:Cu+-exporting ATPase